MWDHIISLLQTSSNFISHSKQKGKKKKIKITVACKVLRILSQSFLWLRLLLHFFLHILYSILVPFLSVKHARSFSASGALHLCFLCLELFSPQISVWFLLLPFSVLYAFKSSWATLMDLQVHISPLLSTPYSISIFYFSPWNLSLCNLLYMFLVCFICCLSHSATTYAL